MSCRNADARSSNHTVLELQNGRYVEEIYKDDEVFDAVRPFQVRIVPAELVRRANRSAV